MEYKHDNSEIIVQARHITVIIDDNTEFRISVDKFKNLEIVKVYGSADSSIHVTPNVSNSIKIT